jgi:hypothetical protein
MQPSTPINTKKRVFFISKEAWFLLAPVFLGFFFTKDSSASLLGMFDTQQKTIVVIVTSFSCIVIGNYLSRFKTPEANYQSIAVVHALLVLASAIMSGLGLYNIFVESNQDVSSVSIVIAVIFGGFVGLSIHQASSLLLTSKPKKVKKCLLLLFLAFILFLSSIFNMIGIFPYMGLPQVISHQSDSAITDYQNNIEGRIASQSIIFDQLMDLSRYSQAKSKEEEEIGYTCEDHIGNKPGPRSELRNDDKETLNRFAMNGQKISNDFNAVKENLSDIALKKSLLDKQSVLDNTHTQFLKQHIKISQHYKKLSQYLDGRIKKGRDGWEYTVESKGITVSKTAFCNDTTFDAFAEDLISQSQEWMQALLPQKKTLLDVNSGQKSLMIINHFLKSVASGTLSENLHLYSTTILAGVGIDFLGLLLALLVFSPKETSYSLSPSTKKILRDSYIPQHKVSIIPANTQECLQLLLHAESNSKIKNKAFLAGKKVNSLYHTALPVTDTYAVFTIKSIAFLA